MRKFLTVMGLIVLILSLTIAINAQESIAAGGTAEGQLSESTDEYILSATAGQVFEIDLFSEDFEPAVSVDDADGFEVAFDFGNETSSSVVFVAPADGDYTINVGEFMGETTGAYSLRVREGGTITAGSEVAGAVENGPEAFAFEGTAGTLIAATLAVEGFEAELELLDTNGDYLDSEVIFSTEPAVIEYLLPEDGLYVLSAGIWFGSDTTEGTFTLNLTEITPAPISYDAALPVEMMGTERQYLAFQAAAGDVIHIVADSGTTEDAEGLDVNLTLTAPNGEDIVSDSSDGVGFDPAITRIIIPEDGFYLIKVIPNDESDESQSGTVDVSVETAELLSLDGGPVSITLGDADRFEQDYVRFTGEPGQTYVLDVASQRDVVSFNISIGDGLFSSINTSVVNGNKVTLEFTLPEDSAGGQVDISLRQSSFQDTNTYDVTLTPAG